jgi:gluconokinase
MIGTSGALRVLYEGEPEPRPGLFCYVLDDRRIFEGGAVSDGGNLYAWLEGTLRTEDPEPGEPDGHGLTFLSLLGGERSPGWNPRATGAVAGLTFLTDPADLFQAALEGATYRLAEIADQLPEINEIVATGHALLASDRWTQLCADVLGCPVTASGVKEGSARGAALHALERLGADPEPAPLGRTYEPDSARTEVYVQARGRQRELYQRLYQ